MLFLMNNYLNNLLAIAMFFFYICVACLYSRYKRNPKLLN